jgi:hypothetical protein
MSVSPRVLVVDWSPGLDWTRLARNGGLTLESVLLAWSVLGSERPWKRIVFRILGPWGFPKVGRAAGSTCGFLGVDLLLRRSFNEAQRF